MVTLNNFNNTVLLQLDQHIKSKWWGNIQLPELLLNFVLQTGEVPFIVKQLCKNADTYQLVNTLFTNLVVIP